MLRCFRLHPRLSPFKYQFLRYSNDRLYSSEEYLRIYQELTPHAAKIQGEETNREITRLFNSQTPVENLEEEKLKQLAKFEERVKQFDQTTQQQDFYTSEKYRRINDSDPLYLGTITYLNKSNRETGDPTTEQIENAMYHLPKQVEPKTAPSPEELLEKFINTAVQNKQVLSGDKAVLECLEGLKNDQSLPKESITEIDEAIDLIKRNKAISKIEIKDPVDTLEKFTENLMSPNIERYVNFHAHPNRQRFVDEQKVADVLEKEHFQTFGDIEVDMDDEDEEDEGYFSTLSGTDDEEDAQVSVEFNMQLKEIENLAVRIENSEDDYEEIDVNDEINLHTTYQSIVNLDNYHILKEIEAFENQVSGKNGEDSDKGEAEDNLNEDESEAEDNLNEDKPSLNLNQDEIESESEFDEDKPLENFRLPGKLPNFKHITRPEDITPETLLQAFETDSAIEQESASDASEAENEDVEETEVSAQPEDEANQEVESANEIGSDVDDLGSDVDDILLDTEDKLLNLIEDMTESTTTFTEDAIGKDGLLKLFDPDTNPEEAFNIISRAATSHDPLYAQLFPLNQEDNKKTTEDYIVPANDLLAALKKNPRNQTGEFYDDIVQNYVKAEHLRDGMIVLDHMKKAGFTPSVQTYEHVVRGFYDNLDVEGAEAFAAEMVKAHPGATPPECDIAQTNFDESEEWKLRTVFPNNK